MTFLLTSLFPDVFSFIASVCLYVCVSVFYKIYKKKPYQKIPRSMLLKYSKSLKVCQIYHTSVLEVIYNQMFLSKESTSWIKKSLFEAM